MESAKKTGVSGVPHIRRIGEEQLDQDSSKRHPAHRWVVERTLTWLQQCRAILICYDKQPGNSLGLIPLAAPCFGTVGCTEPGRCRPVEIVG